MLPFVVARYGRPDVRLDPYYLRIMAPLIEAHPDWFDIGSVMHARAVVAEELLS